MSKKTSIPTPTVRMTKKIAISKQETIINGIVIDENWITPGKLAKELTLSTSTVSNWIARGQIAFVQLPGLTIHKYLVDRRTVPNTSPSNAGRKRK